MTLTPKFNTPSLILYSHTSIIKWLQYNLLPCPFKHLTGIDCPGCGFQRSLLALLQGHVKHSLQLYPATILIILVAGYHLVKKHHVMLQNPAVKKALYRCTALIIASSYLYKISGYL